MIMPAQLARNPRTWFREARIFQVQPPIYADHDGRGLGTLRGITEHLGQINEDGYNCVWVTPFYASPLLDGGFDIIDHRQVHRLFGTNDDLEELCREAEALHIAICAELVMGHTSDQHPWFLASSNPEHPDFDRYRDYYHWTDDPERWAAAPLMFPDQESSNTALSASRVQASLVAQELARRSDGRLDARDLEKLPVWYYHVFFRFQPALNHENPRVRQEVKDQLLWMRRMGIKVVRIDAVPHWSEEPGTDCHSVKANYELFREYCGYAHRELEDLVLLGEINDPMKKQRRYLNYCGFDAVFDLDSHAAVYEARGRGLAAPYERAVKREAAYKLPASATRVKTDGVHDEVTYQFTGRATRHRTWGHHGRRANHGIAGRPMDFAERDIRQFLLYQMALAFLPGAWSKYQGNDLGIVSAEVDEIRPLPFEGPIDLRRLFRTCYPHTDGPGGGFSTATPKRFPAPVVARPFGSRAAQLGLPYTPLTITTGINALRMEHSSLLCTGAISSLRINNQHVAAALRTAPSAAGGVDTLLGVFNFTGTQQHPVTFRLPRLYGGYVATAVHTQLFGENMSEPWAVCRDASVALTLGPYDAHYYLVDPPR
jgi:maltose alpha-D-glucosyltransferase/alpha-amylase